MKNIKLTRGMVATVDDQDFKILSRYKWQAIRGRNTWYAKRAVYCKERKNNRTVLMHQCLCKARRVDHVDGCGLHNWRANLRPATAVENVRNSKKCKVETSSAYKGVSWCSRRLNWRAYIVSEGKQKHLGVFKSERNAAMAYDRAAIEMFGKFSRRNIL